MNVSLTPKLEKMVQRKVKTGMYQTASEVVREGLRLLDQRDRQLEALRADIRVGLDAGERGEYETYDEASTPRLIEEVNRRGRERLAAELRRRKRA